jgi:adenylate cyclase
VSDDPVGDWEAAGLYDPEAPGAADQLDLLSYLHRRGIPGPEMVARHADGTLTRAAVDAVLRPPRRYTLDQAVSATGLDAAAVEQAWLAFGLPQPPSDQARFDEAELELLRAVGLGEQMLGSDAMLQLTRVMGQSLARLAEAAVLGFLVNIEAPMLTQGDPPARRAQSSVESLEALLQLPEVFAPLFLRHLDSVVERQRATQDSAAFDVFSLAIGFLDLVGYTEWSQTVPIAEQGAAMADFERAASDQVTAHGGRVVKNIGDAVMFVTADPAAACEVALALCRFVEDHPTLTALRGAVGHGDLLGRDGDYFGPTVNLVARAVAQAPPGRVVVTAPVAGLPDESLPPVQLRGFDAPTRLWLLSP